MGRSGGVPGPSSRAVFVRATLFLGIGVLAGCDDPTFPGDPSPPRSWTSLGVGADHACASDASGNVFCWGSNDRGQLSAPAGAYAVAPTVSHIGVQAVAVVAGSGYACYLTDSGAATCWGDGTVGQLGNGTPFGSTIGAPVSGGPWTNMSAGAHHLCGIDTVGVKCWGGDRYGASLGTRLPVQSRCTTPAGVEMWWCALDPEPLDEPRDFVMVSAGLWHSCGIDKTGDVYCWGQNSLGQLGANTSDECVIIDPVHGDGHFPCNFDPVRVDLPERSLSVSAGASHTCAVTAGGSAYCWGGAMLYSGQLGHGGNQGSADPVQVDVPGALASVSTSRQQIWTASCGLMGDGTAYCWGSNRTGELGATAPDTCSTGGSISCALKPLAVETEETFVEIDVGEGFVCGRTEDGRILCWGANDVGQLGDGTSESRQTPREILSIQ